MHILLITHHYEPEIGAPQRRWSALVERWQKAGHRVTVFCPPPHYPDRASTRSQRTSKNRILRRERGKYGETVVRMPYILHGFSSVTRMLDQLVAATGTVIYATVEGLVRRYTGGGFDLVISTVPGVPSLFAGNTLAKLLGLSHIAEMRDAWPDVITGDLDDRTARIAPHTLLIKKLIHRTVTSAQGSAKAVVTTTHQFGKRLERRGIQRVETIPNGANYKEFDQIRPLSPNFQHDRGRAELRVQYLGTVGRSQGLTVLLHALEILKFRAPELAIHARIVGSGAQLPRLREVARAKGLTLDFLPPISRADLPAAYRWADVELVSLKSTKPFRWTVPSKIFELLATRRRVLALVEGDAATIVRASGVGTVLSPGDASGLADELQRLAKNPQLLCVGESGVELVRDRYSYESMASHYTQLMREVIGEHPVRAPRWRVKDHGLL